MTPDLFVAPPLGRGRAVTATINAPSVGSIAQDDPQAMTDYPATPTFDDAADIANRDAAVTGLTAIANQIAADDQGALASLAAGKAAAAPLFQVSIGDLSLATAAFENAGIALASVIADGQGQAEEALSGAQTSLNAFFNAEDARLLVAKASAQSFVNLVQTTIAQITADREAAAASDKAAAAAIVQAASTGQAEYLQKLNYTRDVEWPTLFQDRFMAQLVDRLQTVLDVAGIFDPTGIADGANGLIYWVNGDTFNAKISFAGAIVPYFGDVAKTLKLGKYADDGLEAIRRVADDFFGLAGKVTRYGDDACEAATALGAANKAQGFAKPIGCFGAEMEIEMAPIDPGILRLAAGVERVSPTEASSPRWLWMSLIVGVAFAGRWTANWRLRRKDDEDAAKQHALLQLFVGEPDADDCDEELAILATARERGANFLTANSASCAVFAELSNTRIRVAAGGFDDSKETLDLVSLYGMSDRLRYDQKIPQAVHSMKTSLPIQPAGIRQQKVRRPRRQSRLGLIWLAAMLSFAAWVGFGPIVAHPHVASSPAPVSGRVSSTPVSLAPRTKRIADVRVGDRVKAENPTGEEDLSLGAEVDPASWRKLVLRASKKDGSWADVELLRPLSWIEERRVRIGGTAPISVPECGIDGNADVLAIEPCPAIAPGDGRVVTGTFHHSSAQVLNMEIEGLASQIVTTTNHLFWSADRKQFVRADSLMPGEHLRGRDGLVRVKGVTPRGEIIPVYNLEVHIDHVFHVGGAGILVHNNADDCVRLYQIRATAITPPADNARGALRAAMGTPPPGLVNPQAHHNLPWTFKDWFAAEGRGLNVNDKRFGRWVEGTPPGNHQRWTREFEEEWRRFIRDHDGATREEVLEFMERLANDPRFQ